VKRAVKNATVGTEEELLARCVRGDSEAYGAVVLRYQRLVTGVAYRVCGDATLAEDVAQETFIRVWRKLSTYRPGGNFRAWICRIATNLTIDALRRRKPVADIDQVVVESKADGPEATALKSERAAAVRRAILKLPVHSRTALVLREYEGLSYREIADALDIPLGTVKSRLSDARRRLQAELAGYLEE